MIPHYREKIDSFYGAHPGSVSSPFGGIIGGPFKKNPYLDEVLAALGVVLQDKRVLDVGCGAGWLASYCTGKVALYAGMDLSNVSIGLTRAITPRVVRSDGDALPFKNGSFDYIFYVDSFEHMRDQAFAAREAWRVLADGGNVFLSVPNYSNVCGVVKTLEEFFGPYERNTWAPFDKWTPQALEHFMTPWRVKAVFSKSGFRRFKMIGGRRDFIDGIFPWIDHRRMRGAWMIRRAFASVERPLNRLFPCLSLHNFWVIEKWT